MEGIGGNGGKQENSPWAPAKYERLRPAHVLEPVHPPKQCRSDGREAGRPYCNPDDMDGREQSASAGHRRAARAESAPFSLTTNIAGTVASSGLLYGHTCDDITPIEGLKGELKAWPTVSKCRKRKCTSSIMSAVILAGSSLMP
jgi:hypothetical protein